MGKAAAVKAVAAKQGGSSSRASSASSKVVKTCAFCFWLHIYLWTATLCNFRSMWSWLLEPVGFQCQHPPLPANQTGLKVLIYSLPKTGTTTMNMYLLKLGLRSYHSEDFLFHIWAPLADEYWSKPENGGIMFPSYRLAVPGEPAYKGHSFWPNKPEWASDHQVLNGTPPERLADMFARCRTEAVVFDGVEDMFWPVYNVSPGVKVIMLSWRTHAEYDKSFFNFGPLLVLALLALNHLNTGQHFLPWNAFVIPFLDYLSGRHISKFWRDGTPLSHDNTDPFFDPIILLFRQSMTERRICQHWNSGMIGKGRILNESLYDEWWEEGRRIIPKDRLLEFDYKKHTTADLCSFLEIKDNPNCHLGKLKNVGNPIMTHERQHKLDMLILVPYFMVIHFVNYKIFYLVLGWLRCGLLSLFPGSWCSKRVGKKSNSDGKNKAA